MTAPADTRPPRSRALTTLGKAGLILVTLLLALQFAGAGLGKFSSTGGWAREFTAWGYPVWFRLFIGGVEVVVAGLVLIPATAAYGAGVVWTIMAGAIVTKLTHGQASQLLVDFIASTLAAIVFVGRRGQRWKPGRGGAA